MSRRICFIAFAFCSFPVGAADWYTGAPEPPRHTYQRSHFRDVARAPWAAASAEAGPDAASSVGWPIFGATPYAYVYAMSAWEIAMRRNASIPVQGVDAVGSAQIGYNWRPGWRGIEARAAARLAPERRKRPRESGPAGLYPIAGFRQSSTTSFVGLSYLATLRGSADVASIPSFFIYGAVAPTPGEKRGQFDAEQDLRGGPGSNAPMPSTAARIAAAPAGDVEWRLFDREPRARDVLPQFQRRPGEMHAVRTRHILCQHSGGIGLKWAHRPRGHGLSFQVRRWAGAHSRTAWTTKRASGGSCRCASAMIGARWRRLSRWVRWPQG